MSLILTFALLIVVMVFFAYYNSARHAVNSSTTTTSTGDRGVTMSGQDGTVPCIGGDCFYLTQKNK